MRWLLSVATDTVSPWPEKGKAALARRPEFRSSNVRSISVAQPLLGTVGGVGSGGMSPRWIAATRRRSTPRRLAR